MRRDVEVIRAQMYVSEETPAGTRLATFQVTFPGAQLIGEYEFANPVRVDVTDSFVVIGPHADAPARNKTLVVPAGSTVVQTT